MERLGQHGMLRTKGDHRLLGHGYSPSFAFDAAAAVGADVSAFPVAPLASSAAAFAAAAARALASLAARILAAFSRAALT